MNVRKTKKRLKKQINKLESDNALMRKIIEDNPKMQELYNLYNKPLNITHSTIEFQEYRTMKYLPPENLYNSECKTLLKKELAYKLFEKMEENITYIIIDECNTTPSITTSIFIGKK